MLELRCGACDWSRWLARAELVAWLQKHGRLLRDRDASIGLMGELARAVAPTASCPGCGSSGLSVHDPDEAEDWPEARTCVACGGIIPAERLEVFPDAELCVRCQSGEDRGGPAPTGEYCPRCGSMMVVRTIRGTGITRQRLVCSRWPGCRGAGE